MDFKPKMEAGCFFIRNQSPVSTSRSMEGLSGKTEERTYLVCEGENYPGYSLSCYHYKLTFFWESKWKQGHSKETTEMTSLWLGESFFVVGSGEREHPEVSGRLQSREKKKHTDCG